MKMSDIVNEDFSSSLKDPHEQEIIRQHYRRIADKRKQTMGSKNEPQSQEPASHFDTVLARANPAKKPKGPPSRVPGALARGAAALAKGAWNAGKDLKQWADKTSSKTYHR
jgi:hypothetical protein